MQCIQNPKMAFMNQKKAYASCTVQLEQVPQMQVWIFDKEKPEGNFWAKDLYTVVVSS